MNEWHLVISLLDKSDGDQRFQSGAYLVSEITATFLILAFRRSQGIMTPNFLRH